jgi:hypothetical protein
MLTYDLLFIPLVGNLPISIFDYRILVHCSCIYNWILNSLKEFRFKLLAVRVSALEFSRSGLLVRVSGVSCYNMYYSRSLCLHTTEAYFLLI